MMVHFTEKNGFSTFLFDKATDRASLSIYEYRSYRLIFFYGDGLASTTKASNIVSNPIIVKA